ncbi:hypothetical protein AW27_015880 [Streptomyces sp. PCS3-D2]|uniref:hypothetical protein n=1 Tax=Streptomyces sp. PCS3-D2 TaxID=1460244 RepID=UPI00044EFA18|nr:hypothetical protein [Streptomyces sp. PCS3-D2]WKV72882.1 hypothetical protein AW27_015880 [Streptomyces sp. PCS3-D2]
MPGGGIAEFRRVNARVGKFDDLVGDGLDLITHNLRVADSVLTNSGQPVLERAGAFLPFTAGGAMTSAADTSTTLLDSSAQLGPFVGGMVFLALIAAKTAAAVTAFQRRDA